MRMWHVYSKHVHQGGKMLRLAFAWRSGCYHDIEHRFFEDIRGLIVTARDSVARGINLVQVHTNFEIGRRIIKQEQQGKDRAAYGQEVIRALSDRLTTEFGKGFSASNLAYMRSFYLAYQARQSIFQSATGKLGSENMLQAGNE
jgi:DUF1016 N-terminal domain